MDSCMPGRTNPHTANTSSRRHTARMFLFTAFSCQTYWAEKKEKGTLPSAYWVAVKSITLSLTTTILTPKQHDAGTVNKL